MKPIMNVSIIDTGKLFIAEAYLGGYFTGGWMLRTNGIKGQGLRMIRFLTHPLTHFDTEHLEGILINLFSD